MRVASTVPQRQTLLELVTFMFSRLGIVYVSYDIGPSINLMGFWHSVPRHSGFIDKVDVVNFGLDRPVLL
ncbi:hypothetical protein BH20ACI2_BH20ACI2_26390 [soil metagenome]